MSQEISKGILLEQFNLETFASKVLNFLFGPKGHTFGLSGGQVSEIEKGEEEILKQAEQMKREGKSDEEIQAFLDGARAQMLITKTGWDKDDFADIDQEIKKLEREVDDLQGKAGEEIDILDLSDKIKSKLEPSFLRGIKIAFDKADKTAKDLGQPLNSINKIEASQQILNFTLDSIVKQTLGILKKEGILEESKRPTQKYIEKIENYIFEEVKKGKLLF